MLRSLRGEYTEVRILGEASTLVGLVDVFDVVGMQSERASE